MHPDGSDLHVPIDLLKSSPFNDFLIPGIVLFIFNGVGSFLALLAVLLNLKKNYLFVIVQGIVLCGWIVIQIILIKQFMILHYIMFCTGLLLIAVGILLFKLRIK